MFSFIITNHKHIFLFTIKDLALYMCSLVMQREQTAFKDPWLTFWIISVLWLPYWSRDTHVLLQIFGSEYNIYVNTQDIVYYNSHVNKGFWTMSTFYLNTRMCIKNIWINIVWGYWFIIVQCFRWVRLEYWLGFWFCHCCAAIDLFDTIIKCHCHFLGDLQSSVGSESTASIL